MCDDLMLYGTVGAQERWFRGGAGTPEQAARSLIENVINYELGLKGDFLDRTV